MSSIEIKNITNNLESNSDDLHGAIDQVALMHSGQVAPGVGRSAPDHFTDIINHPNSTADHVTKILSLPGIDPSESGSHSYMISEAARSGKLTSVLAESFLQNHKPVGHDGHIRDLSKVPGVSKDLLKDLALKAADDHSYDDIPDFHTGLTSEDMSSIYASREIPDPEMTLTESQRPKFERSKKLDRWFYYNVHEAAYTPEGNKGVVKLLVNPPPNLLANDHNAAMKFVRSNKTLDNSDIESLYSHFSGDEDAWGAMNEITSHPNMPQSLVSRDIRNPNTPSHVKQNIAKNSNLSDDDIQALVSSSDNRTLNLIAENKKLKPNQKTQLYSYFKTQPDSVNAIKDIITSDGCPEELVQDYWNSGTKDSEHTETMLKRVKNLPKSVLSDIIAKNKNIALSIKALDHKNVDPSMLEIAMKRKSPKLQEAAINHPLMIKDNLPKKIQSGAVHPSEVFDSKVVKGFGGSIPDDICKMAVDKTSNIDHKDYTVKDADGLEYVILNQHSQASSETKKDALSHIITSAKIGNEHSRNSLYSVGIHSEDPSLRELAQMSYLDAGGKLLDDLLTDRSATPQFTNRVFDSAEQLSDETNTTNYIKNRAAKTGQLDMARFMDFMKSGEMDHGYSRFSVIYDNQFRNLDEEEKINAYNKVIDYYKDPTSKGYANKNNVGALQALGISQETPSIILNSAYNQASPEDRKAFADTFNENNDFPEEMISDMIKGSLTSRFRRKLKYNDKVTSDKATEYVLDDNYFPNGMLSFHDFPDFDSTYDLDNHNAKNFLTSVFNKNPDFDDISQKAIESISRAVERRSISPNESIHLRQILESNPNPEKQRTVFSQMADYAPKTLRGHLDWMVDSPANHDGYISERLLSRDLLSQEKQNQMLAADPVRAADSIGSLSHSAARQLLNTIHANQKPDLALAQKIHEQVNARAIIDPDGNDLTEVFTSKNNKGEGAWQKQMGEIQNYVNYQVLSGNTQGSGIISRLITANILNNQGKKQAQAVIQSVYNGIDRLPVDPVTKNAAKNSLISSVLQNGKTATALLPESLVNAHIQSVVGSNDLQALMDFSKNFEKTPASISRAISQIADNIATLTPEHQNLILDWASKSDGSLAQIKKIHKTILSSAQTPEQRQSAIDSVVKSSHEILGNSNSEAKTGYAVEVCSKVAYDPQASASSIYGANVALVNALDHPKVSDKHKIAAFLSINDSEELAYEGFSAPALWKALPEAVVNDDACFSHAVKGPKLGAMLRGGSKTFDNEKLGVLLDRLQLDPDSLTPEMQIQVCKNMLNYNPNSINESVAEKAMATVGNHFRLWKDGSDGINKASPLADRLVKADLGDLQESISSPHQALFRKFDHIEIRFGRVSPDAYPEYNQTLIGKHAQLVKSVIAQTEIGSEEITPASVPGIINSIANMNITIRNQYKRLSSTHRFQTNFDLLEISNSCSQLRGIFQDKFPDNLGITRLAHGSADLKESFFITLNTKDPIDVNRIYQLDDRAHLYFNHANKITPELLNAIPEDLPVSERNVLFEEMEGWPEKIDSEAFQSAFLPKFKRLIKGISYPSEAFALTKNIGMYHRNNLMESDIVDLATLGNPQDMKNISGITARRLFSLASGKNVSLPFVQNIIENGPDNMSNYRDAFLDFCSKTHHINDIAESVLFLDDRVGHKVLQNPNTSSDTIESAIHSGVESERPEKVVLAMKCPNIKHDLLNFLTEKTKDSYAFFKDSVWRSNTKIHPAFFNINHGYDLFTKQPINIPKSPSIKVTPVEENLVYTAEHSKEKNAIREALAKVPPEGISYQDYKKINAKNAETAAVKKIFMESKGQKATPEDLARGMKDYGGDFHVTYSIWSGAQRHSDEDNLVMQLNTGKDMNEAMKKDPKLHGLFQLMQKTLVTSQERTSNHPVTPFNASWVRIDTSAGENGWIIEETQSDFDAHLDVACREIARENPSGLTINGEIIKPEELPEYKKKIAKIISGWHEASIKATIELAKKNGVKNLYMHGIGVRSYLSGMGNTKEYPVWMQHMYERWPRNNGLEEVDYLEYPNKSDSTYNSVKKAGRSTKCWKFKL